MSANWRILIANMSIDCQALQRRVKRWDGGLSENGHIYSCRALNVIPSFEPCTSDKGDEHLT